MILGRTCRIPTQLLLHIRSSTAALGAETLFFELFHEQVSMVSLNFDHPIFDSPPAAAPAFQPPGQLGQGLVFQGNPTDNAHAFTLPTLGFPPHTHNPVAWGGWRLFPACAVSLRFSATGTDPPSVRRIHKRIVALFPCTGHTFFSTPRTTVFTNPSGHQHVTAKPHLTRSPTSCLTMSMTLSRQSPSADVPMT